MTSLAISASRSTSSGAVPYSSWTIAVIDSTAAAPGVAAVIVLLRLARYGVADRLASAPGGKGGGATLA